MNNKGFTLIELLATLCVIAIVGFVSINYIYPTFSVNKNEAYKLMKNNVISAAYTYVKECEAGIISCDFSFENQNKFTASVLQKKGYFQDLRSPVDGIDVSNCLILKASKSNGVVVIDLIDQCY